MILEVNGATTSQEATIRSILDGDQLTWDRRRLATLVRVHMANEVDLPGDGVDNSAYVTYNASTNTADIYLERRLEADPAFFRRTIAHELGHVVIAHLSNAGRQWFSEQAFGKPFSEWETGSWEQRPEEAAAEAFVDAFLMNAVASRNASRLRVPKDKWNEAVVRLQGVQGSFTRYYDFALASLPNALHGTAWINSELIPPAGDDAWSTQWFDVWTRFVHFDQNDQPVYYSPGGKVGEPAGDEYLCSIPNFRPDSYSELSMFAGGLWRWAGTLGTRDPDTSEGMTNTFDPYYKLPRGHSTLFPGSNLHGLIEWGQEAAFIAPQALIPPDPPYSSPNPKTDAYQNRTQPFTPLPDPFGSDPEQLQGGVASIDTLEPFVAGDVFARLRLPRGSFAIRYSKKNSISGAVSIKSATYEVAWEMVSPAKVAWTRDVQPLLVTPPYPTYDVAGRIQAAPGPGGVVPRRRQLAG